MRLQAMKMIRVAFIPFFASASEDILTNLKATGGSPVFVPDTVYKKRKSSEDYRDDIYLPERRLHVDTSRRHQDDGVAATSDVASTKADSDDTTSEADAKKEAEGGEAAEADAKIEVKDGKTTIDGNQVEATTENIKNDPSKDPDKAGDSSDDSSEKTDPGLPSDAEKKAKEAGEVATDAEIKAAKPVVPPGYMHLHSVFGLKNLEMDIEAHPPSPPPTKMPVELWQGPDPSDIPDPTAEPVLVKHPYYEFGCAVILPMIVVGTIFIIVYFIHRHKGSFTTPETADDGDGGTAEDGGGDGDEDQEPAAE